MHFERNKAVYELYFLCMSQKLILASTCLTNESVLQEAEKSRLFKFPALLKIETT